MYKINRARKSILNKWDWNNPENNINLFIHGAIGIGKTWIIQQVVAERILYDKKNALQQANEKENEKISNDILRLENFKKPSEIQDLLDEHLLVLRLSELSIESIQGIPCPFEEKTALFLMPENFVRFSKKNWIVIFLDELDKADENIIKAITHLIESRKIGSFSFQKDVMIISALNRVTDSWLSRPMPPELKNRAAHIEVIPDLQSWIEWAIPNGIRKDIIAFLLYSEKAGKNWLAVYDNEAEANSTSGFPTPRSWHMASNQMNKLEKSKATYEEMIDELSEFVGVAAANEFKFYYELYHKINIFKILNGEKRIPKLLIDNLFNKSILSEQYIYAFAFINQITADILQDIKHKTNFIIAIQDMLPELQSLLMKFILTNDDITAIVSSTEDGMKLISSHIDNFN
ncbi:MAG: ATP-binding protein [Ferruginibacter sp.]